MNHARETTAFAGIALAALSAAAIAVGPNLARIAFADGADVLAVTVLRGLVMMLICVAILAARRRLKIPSPRVLALCAASGLSFALMSYGYFGAAKHIPVGLAVTIYFVHPLFVTLVSHVLRLSRATRRHMAVGGVVLVGLGLAVGVEFAGMSPVGVGLALLAAIAVTAMILLNARAIPDSDPVMVNFLMVSVTTAILAGWAYLPASGFALPASRAGWLACLAVGFTFTFGLLSFFHAVAMIGAVRATMITSLQPVFAIAFAALLLDEMLAPLQLLGVAIVVAGLALRDTPLKGVLSRSSLRPAAGRE